MQQMFSDDICSCYQHPFLVMRRWLPLGLDKVQFHSQQNCLVPSPFITHSSMQPPIHLHFFFFFFFFFCFLGPHLRHMQVARLGVQSDMSATYTTATAMPDPTCVFDLHHSSCQCWILNLLSGVRDRPSSSWRLVWFITAELQRELPIHPFNHAFVYVSAFGASSRKFSFETEELLITKTNYEN